MLKNLQAFIEAEYSLDFPNIRAIALYFIVALLALQLVRAAGHLSIKYQVEPSFDETNGTINIIYRITAPIVWIYLFLYVSFYIISITGWNIQLSARWLPVFFYWILLAMLKAFNGTTTKPFWAFLLEMTVSCFVAVYFDWAVVRVALETGPLVFDQSNIGFQILLVAFITIAHIISRAINLKAHKSSNFVSSSKTIIPTERTLCEYRRKYARYLPSRFNEDTLLNCIFYSILFIEDHNRPKATRHLERTLFWTGLIKSTGIMQCKSKHVLSDEESIIAGAKKIETIWNNFLEKSAMGHSRPNVPILRFTETWYSYDYKYLFDKTVCSFSALYGDYCGTRELEVNPIFMAVCSFACSCTYNFHSSNVIAHGSIFSEQSAWFPGCVLSWYDGETLVVDSEKVQADVTAEIICLDGANSDVIRVAVQNLFIQSAIIEYIRFKKGFYCYIGFSNSLRNG